MPVDFEKVRARALAAREKYLSTAKYNKANFLVYGDIGTGKTTLSSTCPFPVWIDNFDPGGPKTIKLRDMISKGLIIVSDYSGDTWKRPTKFREWERDFENRRREGLFDCIGTYFLDSLTKWADSMMFALLTIPHQGGQSRTGTIPELKDYLVQQMTSVDYLSMFCELPCNVVCTGHIGLEKDELTGKIETGLLLAGKLSEKVPLVFDEKYISVVQQGGKHVLQTRNDGYWKAETRMGGESFEKFEIPDISYLLKKAGVPFEAKEALFPPDQEVKSE